MTTETANYWTHGSGAAKRPHNWRYLGKDNGYHCIECDMRCSKRELKEATDA